jgi:hypothetical protein
MDDALEYRLGKPYRDPRAALHKQIDFAAAFMKRLKPWEMAPDDALVRSGTAYAMVSSAQLAAYLPRGGRVLLDLSRIGGSLQAQWYNPRRGSFADSFGVDGGQPREFMAPDENDWGLLLQRHP